MSTNKELATIFNEMASVLELTGANSFKVSAHARVARVLLDMTIDVATLADDKKKLTAIEGIGDSSAKKIIEYVETGKVKEHDALLDEIPRGLLQVMKIPGLGPKTVKMLWEQAKVTDIDSLKRAMNEGHLEALPRLGVKSIQNIRESLAFTERSGGRARIGKALPEAERIVQLVAAVPGVKQAQYAGSLRRGSETIGDIDILASTTNTKKLAEQFQTMPGVAKVLVAGRKKCSVRLESGLQVDLRLVEEAAFGAALLYFSGSKNHNVVMREIAIRRKLRLNEYGLFPDDGEDEPPQNRGVKPIAAKTEQDIYTALDLPYIPPEMREDRGEFDIKPPQLIDLSDIKAELHAHTIASDGKMTIEELAMEAKSRGFHTVAVTDHSKASAQANGLSEDRLLEHIDAVHAVNAVMKGITILAGSEVDILANGKLDYPDKLLQKLDIVVASPHVALQQDPKKATHRLIAAIKHPLVHIIGHPTGRMVNAREGLAPDMNAVFEAAVEHDTALEINSNFMRLDLRDVHVRAAVEAGAKIAINTDSHAPDQFNLLRYGVLTARRGWLTAKQCINAWSKTKLHAWLRSKR